MYRLFSNSPEVGAAHDMRDTQASARRILLGEDSRLKLTRVLASDGELSSPKRDDLADEVAAMANISGGNLVLGVAARSRKVAGIPPQQFHIVEYSTRQICDSSVKPPLDAEINKLELADSDGDRRSVIEVIVPKSLFVHQGPGATIVGSEV